MTGKTIAILLGCLAAVVPCCAENHPGWTTLQPKGGGFKIMLPGTPSVENKEIHDSGYRYLARKYRLTRGNLTYSVLYADMGPIVPAGQEDQLLRNSIESMAKADRANLEKNILITFEGHPARIVVMQDNLNWAWSTLVCWDGSHEIIVSLKAPAGEMKPEPIKTFFNTFHLVPSS